MTAKSIIEQAWAISEKLHVTPEQQLAALDKLNSLIGTMEDQPLYVLGETTTEVYETEACRALGLANHIRKELGTVPHVPDGTSGRSLTNMMLKEVQERKRARHMRPENFNNRRVWFAKAKA